jgi:hypothetical protein
LVMSPATAVAAVKPTRAMAQTNRAVVFFTRIPFQRFSPFRGCR